MNESEVKVFVTQSCPTLYDPMDYKPQAPLSMEFSRQEYWSGLLFPSPGGLPDPGMKPGSPALQADSLLSENHLPGSYLAFICCYNTGQLPDL